MPRHKSNRFDEAERFYKQGLSIEEVAVLTGYAASSIKTKLSILGIYDPPLTKRYLDKIWPEWEKACERIRGEGGTK